MGTAPASSAPFDPTVDHVDVEFESNKFRVELMSALDGDWIATQVMSKTFKDPDVYRRVQEICLSVCSVYQGDIPVKLYARGRWLVPGFDRNMMLVRTLVSRAMEFSLDGFFQEMKKEFLAAQNSSGTTQ